MTLLDGLETTTFTVLGDPAPQGSKSTIIRKGQKPVILEGKSSAQRAKHRSWRSAVAEASRDAAGGRPPLDGPLALTLHFRLAMPASRPKRIRALGSWWHTTRPDMSKLLRSTEDAMKDGGLIADDSRICDMHVTKCEVVGWTGAIVTVGPAGVPSNHDRSLQG